MKNLAKLSQHKLLVFGAVFALSLLALGGSKALAFGGGDGSSGSPYQITSCADFDGVDSTSYYVLANDIDCSDINFLASPIGAFSGSFNGANHVITGFHINNPSATGIGLFSSLNDSASVSNLTIFANINAGTVVGGLAGRLNDSAQVTRVATYGSITCEGTCGGVAGIMNDSSNISLSYSTIGITGGADLGGISGEIDSASVNDVYYNGTIAATGTGNYPVGGIVGTMTGGQITNAYAAGSITADSTNASIGGIMGGATFDPGIFSTFAAITITGGGTENGPICSQAYTIAHGGGNYYDTDLTGFTSSLSDSDCAATPISNPVYFNENSTNHPMDDWQFDSTHWRTNFNTYPSLEPLFDPIMLCEEPDSTNTTIHGNCGFIPLGWGDTTWQARWSVHNKNSWHTIDLEDVRFGDGTVTGLTPGTQYDLEFRFTNDFGTSQWGKNVITTTGHKPVTGGKGGGSTTKKVTQTTGSTYTAPATSSDDKTSSDDTKSSITPAAITTLGTTNNPGIAYTATTGLQIDFYSLLAKSLMAIGAFLIILAGIAIISKASAKPN